MPPPPLALALCLALCLSVAMPRVSAATAEQWKSRSVYRLLIDRFESDSTGNYIACSDLNGYCGGSFSGVLNRLDYIQGMGFDAVYLSPVLDQNNRGYHGYWTKDIYNVNPQFGTNQDFVALIEEIHRRNTVEFSSKFISLCLAKSYLNPVVINHMGTPTQTDPNGNNSIADNVPFNLPEHYHPFCMIDYNNETTITQCRLGPSPRESLPDLNTENDFVRNTWFSWISNFTSFYNIDGYRVDATRHVPKTFWKDFINAAGPDTFFTGEVYVTYNDEYVAAYITEGGYPSMENFNFWGYILAIFTNQKLRQTFASFDAMFKNQTQIFPDRSALTIFCENHDTGRILETDSFGYSGDDIGTTVDVVKYKNALTMVLTLPGIPLVYYGAEQVLSSRSDDTDSIRGELWVTLFDTSTRMYAWLAALNAARRLDGDKFTNSDYKTLYTDDTTFVYSRASLVVLVSSEGTTKTWRNITVGGMPFSAGTTLVSIINSMITGTVNTDGTATFLVKRGEPYVFVPSSSETNVVALAEGVVNPVQTSASAPLTTAATASHAVTVSTVTWIPAALLIAFTLWAA
ncbi:Alpha-amylase A type-1/2 [Entophlyctis sp. JEL0112]|nr:Alpha-amylase A type-1/2 [Entophlyctis sp. JEL0112]